MPQVTEIEKSPYKRPVWSFRVDGVTEELDEALINALERVEWIGERPAHGIRMVWATSSTLLCEGYRKKDVEAFHVFVKNVIENNRGENESQNQDS